MAQTATTQQTPSANQATTASGTAQTQTAPASGTTPPTKTLQAMVVTGSMIRSVDVETAQPITEITPEAIQQQGFVSVGQILQNVPSVGSSGTSNQSALGDIVGQYASLRGLGAPRTLVLVDGERYTTDLFGQTDLSTIPSSLIDNVQILQDGASSIYGSDAIAGVINITTKKVNGLYLDTYNSTYSPGNFGKNSQFSLTGGKQFDRGSFTVNMTVQDIDGIKASDTWFSNYGFNSVTGMPQTEGPSDYGTIIGASNAAGATPAALANGPITVNAGENGQNIANYHPNTYGVTYPSPYFSNDYANSAGIQSLSADNKLHSFTAKGDYKLTDNITATFTGTYNTNNAAAYIGGYPLSSLTPGTGANLATALGLPAGSLPAVWYPTLSPNSYYNPLPGYTTQFSLPLQAPQWSTDNKIKQAGFRVGLKGEFSLGEDLFDWNAGYSDYRYVQDMDNPGNLNLVNLYNAVGPSFMNSSGQVVCGTPGNVIAGCVPLNPFASNGGLSQAEINYLEYTARVHDWSQTRNAEVNLNGDMFTFPQALGGGDANFAVGADHRDVAGGSTPDQYTVEGLDTNLQQFPGEGSYGINEAYGEINLPLLKDLPGAQLLDLDISHRFSHYSNFGDTNNNSYKFSYQPVHDVLLRASYGTGFRAPSVSNLYGGAMQSFTDYTDPCDLSYGYTSIPVVAQRCQNGIGNLPGVGPNFYQLATNGTPVPGPNSESTTPFYTGANASLKPETSKTYTAGIVYSPSWLSGLNVTLDAYRIRIDNVITLPSADSVLNNCYILGEVSDCDLFQRSSSNGQVINLLQAMTNEGFVDERGSDLSLSYLFPDTPFGKFKIDTNSTYINSLREQDVAGGTVVSYNLGAYDPILGPVWRFRNTTNLNWSYGNFGATWTIRYYSSLQESCRPDNPAMDEYFPCTNPNGNVQGEASGLYRQGGLAFNDVQLSWQAPWKGRISIGATDVFNRHAPLSYTGVQSVIGPLGPTGTDGYTSFSYNPQYDFGRAVYVKYSQQLF